SPWCVSHLPSPLSSTLFPYTTLFRSPCLGGGCSGGAKGRDEFSRGKRRKPAQQLGGGVGEVDEWGRKHPHGHGRRGRGEQFVGRSEEHTSELQSRFEIVCRLLLEREK